MKPSIPKGTRDFGPVEMAKRNYIFNTIRAVYELYGFQQIETPAMETLQTLMGKYGEEGDKLLFKVLNSGDFMSKLSEEEIRGHLRPSVPNNNSVSAPNYNPAALAAKLCEKGLRYDLTVPFARYVVMHRDELQLPFKRYQIQPVWRADRPQKGRYREFYQCDADIVGSDSLLNEVELMQIIDTVFSRFGIRVQIKINNRKILSGIAEVIGAADKIVDITVAIDKLDKIGIDNVNQELREDGLTEEQIAKLQPIIMLSGTNEEKLATIAEVLKDSETGLKGVDELRFIIDTYSSALNSVHPCPSVPNNSNRSPLTLNRSTRNELHFDLTLARGLNYYTGAIFEVKALDVQIGSITGGGRYDNLTGIFGLPGLSGVGISFGADRIYDVLNQLDLYPKESMNGTQVLFINFGQQETAYCLPIINKVRENGIRAEIYPDATKMKKQMSYANAKQIPFVALAGENEINAGKVTLKNMETGEQSLLTPDELIDALR
jgi:histidyl-tRNA synthetase